MLCKLIGQCIQNVLYANSHWLIISWGYKIISLYAFCCLWHTAFLFYFLWSYEPLSLIPVQLISSLHWRSACMKFLFLWLSRLIWKMRVRYVSCWVGRKWGQQRESRGLDFVLYEPIVLCHQWPGSQSYLLIRMRVPTTTFLAMEHCCANCQSILKVRILFPLQWPFSPRALNYLNYEVSSDFSIFKS